MTEAALSLDCLGMKCPRPIIELNTRIGEVAPGEVIELVGRPCRRPRPRRLVPHDGQELVIIDPPGS